MSPLQKVKKRKGHQNTKSLRFTKGLFSLLYILCFFVFSCLCGKNNTFRSGLNIVDILKLLTLYSE